MDSFDPVIGETWRLINQTGTTWKLADGREIDPTEEDVRRVLDRAVETLYDGDNNQIEVAGLLIRKAGTGYDVYVMAGHIEGE